MAQSPEQVMEDVRKGKYAPVYFLQGEEPFFIDQISDYVENNALDETQKGFNQVVMYGKDIDMNAVLLNAKRFPMMSDRQVVIVKEAQEIKDIDKEKGQKALSEYVKSPLPSTILVFAYKSKPVDGRKALSKDLDKYAVLVNSKPLYENQIGPWLSTYLKSRGLGIEQKALAMLVDSVGNDLSRLVNEVDKLLINLKGEKEITDEHVQRFVGVSKEYNVFELQKSLGERNILRSNKIIHNFQKDAKKYPATLIVPVLMNYFVKILSVHAAKDKSERALSEMLGVHAFFVKDYTVAARNYSVQSIVQVIKALKNADLQAKGVIGGSIDDSGILQELTYKILHS